MAKRTGPFDDTERFTRIMEQIGENMVREYGALPDMVLIVRFGEDARTGFASAMELGASEARDLQNDLLKQAAAQSDRRHRPRL
jgi:hypothetical protein